MNTQDIDQINQILKGLVGENCFQPHVGYGDELKLEIGTPIPYRHPRMKHLMQGSWMLGARASYWELEYKDAFVITSEADADEVRQKIQVLVNTQIKHALLLEEGLILEVTFSNDYILRVYPDPDAAEDDICDWELFTPDKKILEVGPHDHWALSDATKPMSKSD